MFAWLNGKKTIISAIVTAVMGALTQQHVISPDTGNTITIILGALSAVFMRAAIGNQEPPK